MSIEILQYIKSLSKMQSGLILIILTKYIFKVYVTSIASS